ncbi:hypothetical protein H310_13247 [Aphanomyces invadans]|uniref:RCC1-like domain-containing protein n=1 Tax=Aphanomyces invadans TaxID=157072 RepID=A0A024TG72_9STRA|nr:hypothetical protein H310_13247 [Aphanomyces invadans]ETV92591.1 hypothetical protein H310_13247 [Aphanomyces invadans]|eukprot:XP_008878898.1 hypothetical protein H310_13247 [Aphanomyces invadans]
MGWEGTTGHLYLSGSLAQSNGVCKKYVSTQGRKIKAVYGNYASVLALCDGWEFEWMSPEIPGLANSLNDVKIHQLAFGKAHTAALSLDGHVFVWGDGRFGQLGLGGTIVAKEHPVKIGQLDHLTFKSIACGGFHTAALSESGDLYTWGRNFEGQLGHTSASASCAVNEKLNGVFHRPKHVAPLLNKKCKQVACGDKFTVALTVHGDIYAFGEGQAGQLGTGRCTKVLQPTLALTSESPDDPFVEIACGWAHTLAMTQTGRLFSWGFNQYGQLGASDTKTRFTPEQVVACVPVAHVFAGGNYSAAISRSGRLMTWGNAMHGKLAHGTAKLDAVLAPTLVQDLKDVYVQAVACSWDNLVVFAPTWVSGLHPQCGVLSGGCMLRVFGSGFWESDDLTVRFVPLTEGRLPRAALASFDPATGVVSCVLPKFSVAGEFAVEVAMNGKHFTTNGHRFEVYIAPTIAHISHDEITHGDTPVVALHFTGDKPKTPTRPVVKWVPLHSSFAAIVVEAEYGRAATDDQEEHPHDDVNDPPASPNFTITVTPPSFDSTPLQLVPCTLDVSLNGQDFDQVHVHGASSPHVVYFHKAQVTRCSPNSMPFTDKRATVAVHIDQLFDIGRIVCKATYSECDTATAAPYRVATAMLPVVSVKLNEHIVVCSVPAFAEWTVHTVGPVDPADSDDESAKNAPRSTSWVPLEPMQAQVHVSINGGVTFLPPASPFANALHGYTHGALTDVVPSIGPITGGTVVSLAATHLAFDTDDAVVSVEYGGDMQTVHAFVRKAPEADHRVVTFQVPSFALHEHHDAAAAPGTPGHGQPPSAFSPAIIRLALSGTSFGDATIPFEFYRDPVIRSIEPQLASAGTVLSLTGSFLKTTSTMKCKLTKADGSFAADVAAEYKEEKAGPCYKVELPQLGTIANGELIFHIALNGQQFATTDSARFTYVDQPEVPLGKEDKRKH